MWCLSWAITSHCAVSTFTYDLIVDLSVQSPDGRLHTSDEMTAGLSGYDPGIKSHVPWSHFNSPYMDWWMEKVSGNFASRSSWRADAGEYHRETSIIKDNIIAGRAMDSKGKAVVLNECELENLPTLLKASLLPTPSPCQIWHLESNMYILTNQTHLTHTSFQVDCSIY